MDPELQKFERENEPFSQYVNSYGVANMDEETRRQYRRWKIESYFHKLELNAIRAEGVAEGIAEEKINIAKNAVRSNISVSDISIITGLSVEEIEALRDQEY